MAGDKKAKTVKKKASKKKATKKKAPRKKAPRKKAELAEPTEDVIKLSEIDLLRFLNTDTELNNHQLEIRNISQEEHIEKAAYEQNKATRIQRINALKQSIKVRSQEQKTMLVQLGEKYGFDPSTASIDDKTGIVHVHQQE